MSYCEAKEEASGMIDKCTFTGIDTKTDLDAVIALSRRHKALEFGVLFSRTPEDKDARYPTRAEIEVIISKLEGVVPVALHICGRAVGEFVAGVADIRELASRFDRVQLNFSLPASPFGVAELDGAIRAFGRPVITQHFPSNAVLAEAVTAPTHHVLHDTSGGRGIATDSFPPPFPNKYTGFAGGIGPENIADKIADVLAVSGGATVWIDMESRIRTDGYLDLEKCEAAALAFEKALMQPA
jgi:phosphoribosylanthranilate isomerase